jgi:hypothetical protein
MLYTRQCRLTTAIYIRVPNFILAFIPAEINGNTLNTMTAFAVGISVSPSSVIYGQSSP